MQTYSILAYMRTWPRFKKIWYTVDASVLRLQTCCRKRWNFSWLQTHVLTEEQHRKTDGGIINNLIFRTRLSTSYAVQFLARRSYAASSLCTVVMYSFSSLLCCLLMWKTKPYCSISPSAGCKIFPRTLLVFIHPFLETTLLWGATYVLSFVRAISGVFLPHGSRT